MLLVNRLPVEMRVDEPRRDDVAGGVNRLGALDGFLGNDGDPAVLDAHIGDAVVHRLGIHDPAIQYHDVVPGSRSRRHGRAKAHGQDADQRENTPHLFSPLSVMPAESSFSRPARC